MYHTEMQARQHNLLRVAQMARDYIAGIEITDPYSSLPDEININILVELDTAIQGLTVPSLRPEEIGHFEEYEDFPLAGWKEEVRNDDTRMGYHEWADCAEAVRDEKEYDEEQERKQHEEK